MLVLSTNGDNFSGILVSWLNPNHLAARLNDTIMSSHSISDVTYAVICSLFLFIIRKIICFSFDYYFLPCKVCDSLLWHFFLIWLGIAFSSQFLSTACFCPPFCWSSNPFCGNLCPTLIFFLWYCILVFFPLKIAMILVSSQKFLLLMFSTFSFFPVCLV